MAQENGTLVALEGRLKSLEDEREILRTLHTYLYALDYDPTDATRFLDCFTEDARWWLTESGQYAGDKDYDLHGHREIKEWFLPHQARRTHPTVHQIAAPVIRINGDQADVMSYVTSIHVEESGPVIYVVGRYRDSVVRCPDGRWRIKTREIIREGVHSTWQRPTADAPAAG